MKNILPFYKPETIEAEAREWLIRLDGDELLTPSELKELKEWASRSPAHRQELERISAFWDSASILTELAVPLKGKAVQSSKLSDRCITRLFSHTGLGSAVAATLIVGMGLLFLVSLEPVEQHAGNGIYATAIGKSRSETLADGSVVHINTDSQIQVNYSEAVRKVRLLRGEAHFEVSQNFERPFEVHVGMGMVKAVGTAFAVRLDKSDVSVLVTEGLVDLATLEEPADFVTDNEPGGKASSVSTRPARLAKLGRLERGQAATFGHSSIKTLSAPNTPSIETSINMETVSEDELARRLAWREGYLVFNGETLSEVVGEVSRYTPMVIEITDPDLRNLKIGGRFEVGELEALFEVLEASFGVQVSHLDDQHVQLRPAG